MKVCFTTDSTCDLTPELTRLWDISVIPLYVTIGSKTYRDTPSECNTEMLFDAVRETGTIPTTSAPSIGDFEEFFTSVKKRCDEIVHVSLSSHLSGACQAARLAAGGMDGVYVVDSLALSTGIALLCRRGAALAADGLSGREIADRLTAMTNKVRTSFLIDRLDYLRKGGRCTSLQTLGANLLRIKPSIEMPDGHLNMGQKLRGSYGKCLLNYVESTFIGSAGTPDTSCAFITHSPLSDPALVTAVREKVEQYAHFEHVYETNAGSVISCHCGPNCLGVLFMVE